MVLWAIWLHIDLRCCLGGGWFLQMGGPRQRESWHPGFLETRREFGGEIM